MCFPACKVNENCARASCGGVTFKGGACNECWSEPSCTWEKRLTELEELLVEALENLSMAGERFKKLDAAGRELEPQSASVERRCRTIA